VPEEEVVVQTRLILAITFNLSNNITTFDEGLEQQNNRAA
jgi:hypothetical protein